MVCCLLWVEVSNPLYIIQTETRFGTVTLTAATILIAARSCPTLSADGPRTTFEVSWERCTVILRHLEDLSQSAVQGIAVLESLYQRVYRSLQPSKSDSESESCILYSVWAKILKFLLDQPYNGLVHSDSRNDIFDNQLMETLDGPMNPQMAGAYWLLDDSILRNPLTGEDWLRNSGLNLDFLDLEAQESACLDTWGFKHHISRSTVHRLDFSSFLKSIEEKQEKEWDIILPDAIRWQISIDQNRKLKTKKPTEVDRRQFSTAANTAPELRHWQSTFWLESAVLLKWQDSVQSRSISSTIAELERKCGASLGGDKNHYSDTPHLIDSDSATHRNGIPTRATD